MPFSEDDVEDFKINNERRKNPPQFDAGMGDDIGGGSDPFGGDIFGGGGGGSDPFGGGGSSDPFGSSAFGGGSDPFGSGGGSDPFGSSGGSDPFSNGGSSAFGDAFGSSSSPFGSSSDPFGNSGGLNDSSTKSQKSTEDAIFDGAKVATVETFNFIKVAVISYKSQTRIQWIAMYRYLMFGSIGLSIISIVVRLFGIPSMDILTGALTSLAFGVFGFMYNTDKAEKEDEAGIDIGRDKLNGIDNQETTNDGVNNNDPFGGSANPFGGSSDPFGGNNDPFGGSSDPFGGNTDPFGGSSDPFGGNEQTEAVSQPTIDLSSLAVPDKPKKTKKLENQEKRQNMSKEEKLEDILDDVKKMKTITRGYLFERISDALDNIREDYANIRKIDDDDKDFRDWGLKVQKSAELLAPKNTDDDDMPYLLELEERLFYFYLIVKRTKWVKDIDKFVDEIVRFHAFDDKKGEMDTNVYGKGIASGDKIYIKIMRSEAIMISLKDIYDKNSKKIKDTKNKMPVVLGVTEEGNAVIEDFNKVNSILVAGEPRSGKSYFAKSMVIQMCAFNSPSEVEFYIYDRKGKTSDFYRMDMPHIKTFKSEDKEIVLDLAKIIDKEDKKRSALFDKAGVINITDYNRKNPDKQLSYVYVLIDEVVSLVDGMDNVMKKEFQGLISQLITRLPNLGVRLFMIPHVVRDDVIKKRTTMNIPCRISVRGSEDHIESTTGAKATDFPYKLKNVGDMAVKLSNDVPVFVKASVIASEEDGYQEMIDFVRKLWLKLEPECIEGSYYQQRLKLENKEIVNSSEQERKRNSIEIVPPPNSNAVKKDNNLLSREEHDALLDGMFKDV